MPRFRHPFCEVGSGWSRKYFEEDSVLVRLSVEELKEIIKRNKDNEFIYLGMIVNKHYIEGSKRPKFVVAESEEW